MLFKLLLDRLEIEETNSNKIMENIRDEHEKHVK